MKRGFVAIIEGAGASRSTSPAGSARTSRPEPQQRTGRSAASALTATSPPKPRRRRLLFIRDRHSAPSVSAAPHAPSFPDRRSVRRLTPRIPFEKLTPWPQGSAQHHDTRESADDDTLGRHTHCHRPLLRLRRTGPWRGRTLRRAMQAIQASALRDRLGQRRQPQRLRHTHAQPRHWRPLRPHPRAAA